MNKYGSGNFALKYYEKGAFPLRYRAEMTPEEREIWQKSLQVKIRELMAFPEDM